MFVVGSEGVLERTIGNSPLSGLSATLVVR